MGFKSNLSGLSKVFMLGQAPFIASAENDISKSERIQESKAIIEDPIAMVQSLGFKDKPYSLSYETLRKMATRNSVISSIILTRINQVSTFSKPARYTKDGVGFEITLRDPKKVPNKEQERMILALESFLENCGYSYNPQRDSFDTFLRKILRDSLTYDQLTFEIVPDRLNRPAEIYAVDASTIRAATIEVDAADDYITNTMSQDQSTQWVQVWNGTPIAHFDSTELVFAVRNPRTDMNIQPYGFSELEILIHQITAHLWAEEYNSRYFSQGGTTKGVLNLKGTNISKDQLDAFRRQWTAQLAGMTGAWKTPVVSVEGLEYISVSQSNREMEYEMWMNYLINICCAVYQIDPSEINFPNRGGAGGTGGGGLGDGGIEDRLEHSKDKGLRPLLRFVEEVINKSIIRRFSSEYNFHFVGLDKETEQQRLELLDKAVRSFKTINELRKEKDLPALEDGDIILDPTYTNFLLQKQQNAMMQQEASAPPDGGGGEGEGTEEDTPPEEQKENEENDQISRDLDNRYPAGS